MIQRVPIVGLVFCGEKNEQSFEIARLAIIDAAEKTRTSTVLLPLAPEASASANSATTACLYRKYQHRLYYQI